MTVQIEGVQEVGRKLEALAKMYGRATADAAIAGGQIVRSEAIKRIQEQSPGSAGTRYRNGGGSYTHTASADGDAPNTDTGRLVSSVQVEVTQSFVFVGSTLDYAGWLEWGTTDMAARPWLHPAKEARRDDIERLFQQGVDRVSRQGGDL